MKLFGNAELKRIEEAHKHGISCKDIVALFKGKGVRFSAPALRRYVQLGLIPRSKRIGKRGRYKGSSGLYPVETVRIVMQIKQALDDGCTLEEIRFGNAVLAGEVQTFRHTSNQLLEHFEQAIQYHSNKKRRLLLKKMLQKHRKALAHEALFLERLAERIGQPKFETPPFP